MIKIKDIEKLKPTKITNKINSKIKKSLNNDYNRIDSNNEKSLNIKLFKKIFLIFLIFIIVKLVIVFSKKIFSINSNVINVAYAFDKDYDYITHVSMKSIMLSQNKNTYIKFYLLVSSEIKEEQIKVINNICEKHKNCEIKFFKMEERYKDLNFKGYITWSTGDFYRLALPDLLPQEKKILYLDSDTLIYKDLTKLYNYNITDKYIAGMLEFKNFNVFGKKIDYFVNTGAIIMNLEELRKDNICKKTENFIRENNSKLLFPVNFSFNYICNGKVGFFSPQYAQLGFCGGNIEDYINNIQHEFSKEEIIKVSKDPYIFHIIGIKNKPWNGIPHFKGTVCYDIITKFYQMAMKTDYYYEILEKYKISRDYLRKE